MNAIYAEVDLPAGQEAFTALNAESAKAWPVITDKKDAPVRRRAVEGREGQAPVPRAPTRPRSTLGRFDSLTASRSRTSTARGPGPAGRPFHRVPGDRRQARSPRGSAPDGPIPTRWDAKADRSCCSISRPTRALPPRPLASPTRSSPSPAGMTSSHPYMYGQAPVRPAPRRHAHQARGGRSGRRRGARAGAHDALRGRSTLPPLNLLSPLLPSASGATSRARIRARRACSKRPPTERGRRSVQETRSA